MTAFHSAVFVRDLASPRRVDLDLFGNQISAHTTGPVGPSTDAGVVDGILVPIPHFGAVLGWDESHRVADRIRQTAIPFSFKHREHLFTA